MNKNGFSLIELVIVIVILGIAIPTSIYVLGALTERSLEAENLTVATNLAQSLMEEMRSKRFDENGSSPWSSALGPDTSTTGLDGLTNETSGGRSNWDDVDDFDGWSQSAIPDFDKFSSEVEVFYVRGDTDLDDPATFSEPPYYTDYKRVEVTIITPEGGRINLVTLIGGY